MFLFNKTALSAFGLLLVLTLTACGGGGSGGGSDIPPGGTNYPVGITLMSLNSNGAVGDGISLGSSVSADGRYVAFESESTNLVAGDTNTTRDVFVRDRTSGETTLVSVALDGVTLGNGFSSNPSISADGRYVAFESLANNLVVGNLASTERIFVHDRTTRATTLVSIASNTNPANGSSVEPSISADGRYVAFESVATNLGLGSANGTWDIFVHDRTTGETTSVSIHTDNTLSNNFAISASISADGRYVAFASFANNLVVGDVTLFTDVFVRDRIDGTTTLVSVNSAGAHGIATSTSPSISADGRYVAFESFDGNFVAGGEIDGAWDIFLRDRTAGTTTLATSRAGPNSRFASISADGRYVAFNVAGFGANVYDRTTDDSTCVWVVAGTTCGSVTIPGDRPAISADGKHVVFHATATDFVPGITTAQQHVYAVTLP